MTVSGVILQDTITHKQKTYNPVFIRKVIWPVEPREQHYHKAANYTSQKHDLVSNKVKFILLITACHYICRSTLKAFLETEQQIQQMLQFYFESVR